jgi:hypothetical protein
LKVSQLKKPRKWLRKGSLNVSKTCNRTIKMRSKRKARKVRKEAKISKRKSRPSRKSRSARLI